MKTNVVGFSRVSQTNDDRSRVTLSMHDEPPCDEITLDEFESFSLDRLQLLRGLEALRTRGADHNTFIQELGILENRFMPLNEIKGRETCMRKDHISHYILRLAYCRTEDLRRWFIQHETQLFKFRLERLSDVDKISFMESSGMTFDTVSTAEKDDLRSCLPGSLGYDNTSRLFKVPFSQALELIASRQVFLKDGMAFVPAEKFVPVIVARYRLKLSKSLVMAFRMYSIVLSDPRISPIVETLNTRYIGRDFSSEDDDAWQENVTASNIHSIATSHFPLCMLQLHNGLSADHKLKHWGRLQYGLFLKGIGMTMEESLMYQQAEFSQAMAADQFIKQYAYNIRHMYGKEGKRASYTPYSCVKIITSSGPGVGDHHGCPYKHYDERHLTDLLSGIKLQSNEVQQMLGHVEKKNYQVACSLHFDFTHPNAQTVLGGQLEGVGNHPNAWYRASMKYKQLQSTPSKPVTVEPAAAHQVQQQQDEENNA